MTFFYDLNKKLDEIRATPSTTHGQLNERDMGKHNNATTGFKALAKKAGGGEKGEKIAGAQFQKMKKAGQLEEEGMTRAAKGYEKYGKQGMEALAKAGRDGNALDPVRKKYDKYDNKEVDEGLGDMAKKVGGMIKKAGGAVMNRLHGSDEDMIRDLQRKTGMPQTGLKPGNTPNPKQVKEKMNPAKAKSFAALAPPKDKITFADKIAGAKKEVDEMLGDVAAEAIKGALSGKQKQLDKNQNGKLDANDFAMLRKGAGKKSMGETQGATRYTVAYKDPQKPGKSYSTEVKATSAAEAKAAFQDWNHTGRFTYLGSRPNVDEVLETDSENAFTAHKRPRVDAPKVGSVERGHKHDIEYTSTGRKVTRRVDDQGHSVGADDAADAEPQKRGRGRPAGTGSKMGAKGPSGRSKLMTKENDRDPADQGEYDQEGEMAKDSIQTVVRHAQALEKILGDNDNLPEWVQSKLAKIEGMMTAVDDYMQNQEGDNEEMAVGEESTNKRDNRAERAGKKVTKDIEYDEKKKDGIHGKKRGSEDEKAEKAGKKVAKDIEYDEKKDKKEDKPKKVKEQGGTDTPTASSGFSYGQGIYDSMNRELETMIRESMNVNMSMNNDANGGPSKSVTVTATDDDAMKLGELLKNAGLGGGEHPNVEGGTEVEIHGAEDLADQIRQAEHNHGGAAFGGEEVCDACGQEDCGCEEMDEAAVNVSNNQPDYPTNTETAQDSFEYSGGLNGPKSTGQTTIPVIAGQDERMGADDLRRLREMAGVEKDNDDKDDNAAERREEEAEQRRKDRRYDEIDESAKCSACDCDPCECNESVTESFEQMLSRMRDIAGIKEGKKPDFLDMDKDGDKKEPMKKAVDDKKKNPFGNKKVAESLMAELQRFKKA